MRAEAAGPIPLAVVGLNFGRSIIRQLTEGAARDHFQLSAVCDLDRLKADKFARLTGARAFYDLEDLLRESDCKAVGLFTPPQGRAGLVRRIIRTGRDVITTKPFEASPSEARDVLMEARALGRVIHLNSPAPPMSPDLVLIEQWREQFALGVPVACRADVWCSYREETDGSWYDDPASCPAAPIFRLGIYLINDLVRLFGPAREVHVLQSRLFTGRPTADNAQMGVLFQNGALANVFASFCIEDGDHYRNSMTINFERGTIYRNAGPERGFLDKNSHELSLVMTRAGRREIVDEAVLSSGSGDYQWEVFSRALRERRISQPETVDQVVAGLRILEALRLSAERGGAVAVS